MLPIYIEIVKSLIEETCLFFKRVIHATQLYFIVDRALTSKGFMDMLLSHMGMIFKTVTWTFQAALWLFKALLFMIRHMVRISAGKRHTFGSARFAEKRDLKKAGMLQGNGLLLGKNKAGLIYAPDHDHMLCMAPTKSGKTTCFVNPNLLRLGADLSTIVNDPNGETFAVTKRERARHGDVWLWSPFSECSNSLNPLDFIRAGSLDEVDDTKLIVDLLMRDTKNSADQYWDIEAKSLLAGLVLYVLHNRPPELRTMAEVRHLLMLGEDAFTHVLEKMVFSGHKLVQGVGNSIMNFPKPQREGVIGSAKSHTNIWDSPRLQKVTGYSDFKFSDLKHKTASVYISIPPDHMATYHPVLKLMMGLAIAECGRESDKSKKRVTFMLDEFANLGRLKPAETAISIARKSGVQLCLFIQDMAQIERVYGDAWKSFAANCRTKVYFGVNDIQEAKRLSDTIGDITVSTKSTGNNGQLTSIMPDRLNNGSGEAGRKLKTPDEIMTMDKNQCLIDQMGERVIVAEKVFYKSKIFKGQYDDWNGEAPNIEIKENIIEPEILALEHVISLPEAISEYEHAYWDEQASIACESGAVPSYIDSENVECLDSHRKRQNQDENSRDELGTRRVA